MAKPEVTYSDYYRERMAEYMAVSDDLTADEIDSLKDGYPVTTDWSRPENQRILEVAAQRKMETKRKHKVMVASNKALADTNAKIAQDAAAANNRLTKEKGTYRNRLDDFRHGDGASKEQLKAEIAAIKNPQKRYQAIRENIDIFQ